MEQMNFSLKCKSKEVMDGESSDDEDNELVCVK